MPAMSRFPRKPALLLLASSTLSASEIVSDVAVDVLAALPPAVTLVGSTKSVYGTPWAIDVKNNIVYLGDWYTPATNGGNFQTYHVLNKAAPVRLSARTSTQEVCDVKVSGSYAYVANDLVGFSIFNVSNPRSCSLASARYDGPGYTGAITLRVNPNYELDAFVSSHVGCRDGFRIYHFSESDPFTIPTPVRYTSPDPTVDQYVDSAVTTTRAYLLVTSSAPVHTWDMSVEALDISRLPAVPTRLGTIDLPLKTYGGRGRIKVLNKYLYVASDSTPPDTAVGGLRIIDASNPAAMRVVGKLDLSDIGSVPWCGTGLAIQSRTTTRSYAYMVGQTRFHMIGIDYVGGVYTGMAEVASAPLPAAFGPCKGGDVVISNGYAYGSVYGDLAKGGFGGLAIYSIKN